MNKLTTLIIETVATCNLKCIMCPTLSYEIKGKEIMSDKTFNSIIENLNGIETVDLTGWGEPLLDNKLFDRIKKCKENDCRVGFTTNGVLLNKDNINKIIDSNVDWVGISFDAGTKKTYENIRRGAKFGLVVNNLKNLIQTTKEKKSKIIVFVTYVIMKNNKKEVYDFLKLFDEIGIKQFYFKPLDVITNHSNYKWVLSKKEIKKIYLKIKEDFKDSDLTITEQNILDKPKNNCIANPLHSLFIAYNGDASPCCYLGHNVKKLPSSVLKNLVIKANCQNYIIGNVENESIQELWEKSKNFRETFLENKTHPVCKNCTLKSSITWRTLRKWRSFIGKIASFGTRRKRCYDLATGGLRIIANEGFGGFWRKFKGYKK